MAIYNKPSIYKKPLPWASGQSPLSSRPSTSIFERLGITRQMPKKEAKPPSPGLFGPSGYRSQVQLREFARKFPYSGAVLPGTVKQLKQKERLSFFKEWMERGKKFGSLYGLSEKTYRERILPQLKKEKYQLHIANKLKEEKLLERKMKAYENLRTKGTFK